MVEKTPNDRRGGPKRRWKTLATLVYLAVASVVLLEVVLRIASLVPGSARNFTSDRDVGFRVRPGWLMGDRLTNSRGFNDVERPPGKTPGVRRVAFIGDSFVFGVVARGQNMVSVFQGLADREGRQLEALNLGIPAAGPENYLRLLRHDAAELSADVVCVVFFVGNDVLQAHPDFVTRVFFGTPRTLLRSPFLLRPSGDYLYTYKLLRAATRWTRNRLGRSRDGAFSRRIFFEIEQRTLRLCQLEPEADVEVGFRESVELLAEMRREARGRGQRFFVVLAPDRLQVEEGLRATLLSRSGESADGYDFDRPQARLGRALEGLGIETLDLLPAFRERAATAPLYLRRDTHWNARGNALAAEVVYRFAADRRLL